MSALDPTAIVPAHHMSVLGQLLGPERTRITWFKEQAQRALPLIFGRPKRVDCISQLFRRVNDGFPLNPSNYLPFKREFVESTGYFDGITVEHLTQPVMWGIEERTTQDGQTLLRPFIAIAFQWVAKTAAAADKKECIVLFQRYPNEPDTVATTTSTLPLHIPISADDLEIVQQLIQGKRVALSAPKRCDRTCEFRLMQQDALVQSAPAGASADSAEEATHSS